MTGLLKPRPASRYRTGFVIPLGFDRSCTFQDIAGKYEGAADVALAATQIGRSLCESSTLGLWYVLSCSAVLLRISSESQARTKLNQREPMSIVQHRK